MTPAQLNELGIAFCNAKVVLTAVELSLFTELSRGPLTLAQLCERLQLHPRGAADFLAVLVALGLVEEDGGQYRNSEAAGLYLDRTSGGYAGAFLEHANDLIYPAWGRLTELIRTGRPQAGPDTDRPAALGWKCSASDQLSRFLDMTDALTDNVGPALAAAIEWENYATVADVGGARGSILAHVLEAYPGLSGYVFDLPAMEQPFCEHMDKLGLQHRASFVAGDFFTDPLPEADVLVLGHVLHDWSPQERVALLRRAYRAVVPGGRLLIYDQLTGGAQDGTWNHAISLTMQLLSPGGSEYSAAECQAWLLEAGFSRVTAEPVGVHDTLVVARKDEIGRQA
jgi:SAM-dependent methyltransferase